ncbi:hypothetical protein [Massilia aquatica]|uniref:Uncharacterized protein n=1 Tax=Massilia aquatica TaxID=2609000 RepID=A0ABX0MEV8_9BURK|nr:hypothetical protein [Massilia aquatica]NHZ42064.1 hypothetical protein [Massilia aquatica]
MSGAPHPAPLAHLERIGVIDAAGHARALAHPLATELAGEFSVADQMVWLACRDILTVKDLRQTRAGLTAPDDLAALDDALHKLALLGASFNRQHLDTLFVEGVISADERAAAIDAAALDAAAGDDDILASPGAALAWVVFKDIIPRRRVWDLRARRDNSLERGAILDQAETMLMRFDRDVAGLLVERIPGSRRLWIGAGLAVAGLLLWLAIRPGPVLPVPACTDPDVLLAANNRVPRASLAQLAGVREVGFASQTRVRACAATLAVDGKAEPFAFTVTIDSKHKVTEVLPAQAALVQARYGHLDSGGKFPDTGAPIGRARLDEAFRAGVFKILARHRRSYPVLEAAPHRVAEVEPVGPCRVLIEKRRYSCRLVIERREWEMDGTGISDAHEGEFIFERSGGPWRVSDDFLQEYVAMLGARAPSAGE